MLAITMLMQIKMMDLANIHKSLVMWDACKCNGDCGGTAVEDECGVCGGDGQ